MIAERVLVPLLSLISPLQRDRIEHVQLWSPSAAMSRPLLNALKLLRQEPGSHPVSLSASGSTASGCVETPASRTLALTLHRRHIPSEPAGSSSAWEMTEETTRGVEKVPPQLHTVDVGVASPRRSQLAQLDDRGVGVGQQHRRVVGDHELAAAEHVVMHDLEHPKTPVEGQGGLGLVEQAALFPTPGVSPSRLIMPNDRRAPAGLRACSLRWDSSNDSIVWMPEFSGALPALLDGRQGTIPDKSSSGCFVEPERSYATTP